MNQAPNIARSVRALFNANITLTSLVPGGLIYGTQPAPTLRPFGSMLVFPDGEPEYTTGAIYAQAYTVLVRVWANQWLGTAAAIQTALETLLTANTKLALLTGNAWTVHCSLEPSTLDEMEQRLFGQFTFMAGARWLVQLQEQRT